MECPLCNSKLEIRIDAFTCHSSVAGLYLKGRVALTCSDQKKKKCRYLHTTNLKTGHSPTIGKLEAIVGKLIRQLPDLGPWEVFALSETTDTPAHGNES